MNLFIKIIIKKIEFFIRFKILDLTSRQKLTLLVLVFLFFCCLFLLMLVISLSEKKENDNKKKEKKMTLSKTKVKNIKLNNYYLYLNDDYYTQEDLEYIIKPEKLEPGNQEAIFIDILKKNKIFNNIDELIQIELNKVAR